VAGSAIPERAVPYRHSKFVSCGPQTHATGLRKSRLMKSEAARAITKLDPKPIESHELFRFGCHSAHDENPAIIAG
jgi:hypothetical protein